MYMCIEISAGGFGSFRLLPASHPNPLHLHRISCNRAFKTLPYIALSYFAIHQRANPLHRHRMSCNWALENTLATLRAKTNICYCTRATLPWRGVDFELSCRAHAKAHAIYCTAASFASNRSHFAAKLHALRHTAATLWSKVPQFTHRCSNIFAIYPPYST